jgi:hypothetical protein
MGYTIFFDYQLTLSLLYVTPPPVDYPLGTNGFASAFNSLEDLFEGG